MLSRVSNIAVSAYHQSSYEKTPGAGDIQTLIVGTRTGKSEEGLNILHIPGAYYDKILISCILLRPKSRGSVRLNETDPVNNQPIITLNYLQDPQDVKVLVEGMKFARKLVNTTALKNFGFVESTTKVAACESFEYGCDGYLDCIAQNALQSGYHATGTCKVGPKNDSNSVVDPELRVYGVQGLRVMDASVIPETVRGNTMAPTIMVGEKGSDLIKRTWLKRNY